MNVFLCGKADAEHSEAMTEQFAESAKLEGEIKKNLAEFGYEF